MKWVQRWSVQQGFRKVSPLFVVYRAELVIDDSEDSLINRGCCSQGGKGGLWRDGWIVKAAVQANGGASLNEELFGVGGLSQDVHWCKKRKRDMTRKPSFFFNCCCPFAFKKTMHDCSCKLSLFSFWFTYKINNKNNSKRRLNFFALFLHEQIQTVLQLQKANLCPSNSRQPQMVMALASR